MKQKVEEEENVEEESDEDGDYEVQSEKRINEWKKSVEQRLVSFLNSCIILNG